MKSAICLIVRNEHLDIAEWVAHYIGIGADRLIIYDDGSDDGTLELLNKLAEHFPIDIVPWKTEEKNHQIAAYTNCLKRFGPEFDWIGFFDADEFLIPPPGASLPQLLERHKDHDAFSLNWLIFGSSGVANTNGHLVMEAFTHRAETQFNVNHHVKTFVKPNTVQRVVNGHYFEGPKIWSDVLGQTIEWKSPGVVPTGNVVLGDWRLHHYMVRSDAHVKRRLGINRVSGTKQLTPESILAHDRNEVVDETALSYSAKARMALQNAGFLEEEMPAAILYRAAPTPSVEVPDTIAKNMRLHLDDLNYDNIRGWVQDSATDSDAPTQLRFIVDGHLQDVITCEQLRLDVASAGFKARSGFDFVLPRALFDGKDHTLAVQTLDGQHVPINLGKREVLEHTFSQKWLPTILSQVDGFQGEVLRGWVLKKEEDGKKVGGSVLAITCDGRVIGNTRADQPRPDVAYAHSADANCGFEFTVPAEFRTHEAQRFGVKLDFFEIELYGSPVTHNFRDSNSDLPPRTTVADEYTLENYNEWYWRYAQALHRRVDDQRRLEAPADSEKSGEIDVSVICPVYRPDLADFVQAVESVICQTHKNWELILVNDGSQMPALTTQLDAFAKRDSRIRVIKNRRNGGIASATNTAVEAARGKYVAFFDHDDLIAPEALEVMLREAKASKALLLYSDEDKVKGHDDFSDPAFKPNWNYRLMLSANYVCHFVMVDRAELKKAGPFSSSYDGAQDHAMLLRLSEIISHDRIVHVPEILYHWRISARSTAGGAAAKPYAIAAGQSAIEAHLQRRGIPAHAHSIASTTWYKVDWPFTEEPKVCIIIPFKDSADIARREALDITRECLHRVLERTEYGNYEVILVDNGSDTVAAKEFCAQAVQDPRVRVLQIDAPFNFSYLNNQAARQTDAKYLVLMNNDLHVHDGSWMRVLVNEFMADSDVGIVGGKFLYPNRTVQHAGVVIGVGGVAGHINGGISESNPGYGGRALFAQELTAVTAAGLMVEAKLFWEVGGLDETLKVAFNDVDLCIKVRKAGHKVIWTPEFMATHHESLSRGLDHMDPGKRARFISEAVQMQQRWGEILVCDPAYSRFFDLDCGKPFNKLVDPAHPPTRSASLPSVQGPSEWIHG